MEILYFLFFNILLSKPKTPEIFQGRIGIFSS